MNRDFITEEEHDGTAEYSAYGLTLVIRFHGDVDIEMQFRYGGSRSEIERSDKKCCIDVTGVNFMDSSGIWGKLWEI